MRLIIKEKIIVIGDDKRKLKKRNPKKVLVKFFAEEMIEKTVNASDGRVYLPRTWIGQKVKIVRC